MINTKVRDMWEERVKDYNSSGQTVSTWCKSKDVKPNRMRCWIREFKANDTDSKKVTNWVSVETIELKAINKEKPLLIKIGAATIEVTSNFDKELFSKVTEVLLAQC